LQDPLFSHDRRRALPVANISAKLPALLAVIFWCRLDDQLIERFRWNRTIADNYPRCSMRFANRWDPVGDILGFFAPFAAFSKYLARSRSLQARRHAWLT
jgi:hypothetical protein